MKFSLVVTFTLIVGGFVATSGIARANDVYIAQVPAGANNGADCADALVYTYFNSAGNWTSSSPTGNQIGPGTTVHLCGTFTSSAQGGNVLTAQGSGTPGNPVTVLFQANAQMNSTGWWGSYNADACTSCTGAITVNGQNYITIDGGTNGIIQNTLSGTPGNSCSAGACTQQPGNNGSLGVHLFGDNLIVRNLTIEGIYMNSGASSSATDTGGSNTADIRVDGSPTNLLLYNNNLFNARAGIWGGFNGSTGPGNCPALNTSTGSGICIYGNSVSDHAWQMTLNSAGSNNVVNVYGNTIGNVGSLTGWLNWQYPTNLYHQDGIFIWGSSNNQVVSAYIYDNYIQGDLGQGSPSGMIYCASNGANGSGTGCSLTAFNNLIVGTGSAASNDQIIALKLDTPGTTMGPVNLYNNTLIGGEFSVEMYNVNGGPSVALTAKNNVFFPGTSGTPRWFYHQENGGSPLSSVFASGNDYYNGNNLAWNFNGGQYSSLSAWQAACNCDSGSLTANPQLASNYYPTSLSPLLTEGSDLTSLGINMLDADMTGQARPGSWNGPPAGPWTTGAYNGGTVAPPTWCTAAAK